MTIEKITMPPLSRSLSARLLILTVLFVMLAEVLIFTPSVGRFRLDHLTGRLASAHLAMLTLEAAPENVIGEQLAGELLSHVDAHSIALRRAGDDRKLMLMAAAPPPVDASFDLRMAGIVELIREAFVTLLQNDNRVLVIAGTSPIDDQVYLELVMDEAPLRDEIRYFGLRILGLSLIISAITAGLVFTALHLVFVRPMRRLTENMTAFREDPEDPARIIRPSQRQDEIGVAERQLEEMQRALRASLHQKTRLAAVGIAVTKINHDLRNILTTAQLASDRLAASGDPEVRRQAPQIIKTLDRAIQLCAHTLNFTREGPAELHLSSFDLSELLDEVKADLPTVESRSEWVNRVAKATMIEADRDQLYRVFHNLGTNALNAGASRIEVVARTGGNSNRLEILVTDDGPGLVPRARAKLFQPFSGTARTGGTGLGLAIARELLRAHGGEITLARSDANGTRFRLELPVRQKDRRDANHQVGA